MLNCSFGLTALNNKSLNNFICHIYFIKVATSSTMLKANFENCHEDNPAGNFMA